MIKTWRTVPMLTRRLDVRRSARLAAAEVERGRQTNWLSQWLYAFAWLNEYKGLKP